MRSITHCPNCETEFFVNHEQLTQHNGKVRCGHCLNVFDAKSHEIESSIEPKQQYASVEIEEIAVDSEDNSESTNDEAIVSTVASDTVISHADDLANRALFSKKRQLKVPTWLLAILAALLLITATVQSVYFLRTEIATYYPITKPYVVEACKLFKCTVDLPKKIELIAIDDSDIQEDADYEDLMRFSSTLINQANFNQQFPNLELTLTDVDDKPMLRRVFKPSDYLPSDIDVATGIAAGQEVKIKLAITANGTVVAGYRVFVTY